LSRKAFESHFTASGNIKVFAEDEDDADTTTRTILEQAFDLCGYTTNNININIDETQSVEKPRPGGMD